ncbi:MAG: cycloisomerase [Casimicrobium sp.]
MIATSPYAQTDTTKAKPATREFAEVAKFTIDEARQGVGVDKEFFYAVTNQAIGKYNKKTGAAAGKFTMPKDGPIIHFDSAAVIDGKIVLSHSNYPQEPMTSSIEIIDAATMKHLSSHSFGIRWGSMTWVDRHEGAWWATFGNYSRVFGTSQRPYGNSYWTTLVKFNDQWQEQQAWIYPTEVIKRSEPMSISGGSWGPDGLLYVTGHDHPEVYALRIPKMGSILEHVETIPMPLIAGQGIAWDRSESGVLWGIHRANKQVIASRIQPKK